MLEKDRVTSEAKTLKSDGRFEVRMSECPM